jgi:2-oxoisovalerate dehydrogenase E1 component
MATVRRFEERCVELGVEGLIAGSIHLCFGQEAVPIGARSALTDRDRVLATYRGHGWAIACGVPLTLLLAEICQRAGGVNGGRGGSPYLTSPSHGFVGENSIVGAHLPIAAGVAMAARAQGQDRVVLASFGDGAMNQGAAHEGMVFAAARELPIIFVCENNDWSEMTPIASMVRSTDLAERAIGYGITSRIVDGGDPLAVAAAVAQAADEARRGAGPVFLECKAARLRGHYNRDIEHYRPKHDAEAARAGDPMERLRTALLESGELSEAELDDVDGQVQAAVDAATREVRAMPEPDPSTARDHVRAPAALTPAAGPELAATDEMTFIKAVTAALRAELAARPDVLVYGEDVGYAGGIFGATRGLQEEFGSDRVFDTPIAESAIIGSAVGAAMEGMRPVVEVMWGDFLLVALDQLINQAANVRYLSRSERNAPMVLRTQQGVTPGSCAQHSQSLEAFLAHIPGIKVGLAATPQDAYAMLRAAVADPDP